MPEDDIVHLLKNEITRIQHNDRYFDSSLEKYLLQYYREDNIVKRLKLIQKRIIGINEEIKTNFCLVAREILTDEQFKDFNDSAQFELVNCEREHNRLKYLDIDIDLSIKRIREF